MYYSGMRRGLVVEQKVLYDWKPTLCKYCKKYGHSETEYRKKKWQNTTLQEENPVQEEKEASKQNTKSPIMQPSDTQQVRQV